MRLSGCSWLALIAVVLATSGCGGFMARRIAQAPNSYPQWMAPEARVELAYSPGLLAHFDTKSVEVGPPSARLTYRIIDPADYDLQVSSSRQTRRGRTHFRFTFEAVVPGEPIPATSQPRGTVLLLHGHGLAHFSIAPWGLRLAQEGWRSVLVNLRGHGTSTGRRIYFGVHEVRDLSQLLDALEQGGKRVDPVVVMGESYGAAVALRWKGVDPRISSVVAIAPYARLGDAVLNIRREYARWVPRSCIQAGLHRLPTLLEVEPGELDPIEVLTRRPVNALFVSGADDRITPPEDVRALHELAADASQFLLVPGATHEAISYFFDDLAPALLDWFDTGPGSCGD
jgi:pimeloyl-ACP methyl ester carboxylesterase